MPYGKDQESDEIHLKNIDLKNIDLNNTYMPIGIYILTNDPNKTILPIYQL